MKLVIVAFILVVLFAACTALSSDQISKEIAADSLAKEILDKKIEQKTQLLRKLLHEEAATQSDTRKKLGRQVLDRVEALDTLSSAISSKIEKQQQLLLELQTMKRRVASTAKELIVEAPHSEMETKLNKIIQKLDRINTPRNSRSETSLDDGVEGYPLLAVLLERNPALLQQVTNNPLQLQQLINNPQLVQQLASVYGINQGSIPSSQPSQPPALSGMGALYAKQLLSNPLLFNQLAQNPSTLQQLLNDAGFVDTVFANPHLAKVVVSNTKAPQILLQNINASVKIFQDPYLAQLVLTNPDVSLTVNQQAAATNPQLASQMAANPALAKQYLSSSTPLLASQIRTSSSQYDRFAHMFIDDPQSIKTIVTSQVVLLQFISDSYFVAKILVNPSTADLLFGSTEFADTVVNNPQFADKVLGNPYFALWALDNPVLSQKMMHSPELSFRILSDSNLAAQVNSKPHIKLTPTQQRMATDSLFANAFRSNPAMAIQQFRTEIEQLAANSSLNYGEADTECQSEKCRQEMDALLEELLR